MIFKIEQQLWLKIYLINTQKKCCLKKSKKILKIILTFFICLLILKTIATWVMRLLILKKLKIWKYFIMNSMGENGSNSNLKKSAKSDMPESKA